MTKRRSADWRQIAAKLAATLPRERLHPAAVARAEASPPRERWLVAFSGGADSLGLLLLLWTHWPERREQLVAVHFNHRLRGAEALRDERFCARVCRALGVRFRTERWSEPPVRASEAQARAARHAFFGRELRRARSRVLWFGHQQDDVAETLLMRLARGSGTSGLAAPRPVQSMPGGRVHLRPLLALNKAEVAGALRRCGGSWCEDRTNAVGDYLRTRIRRDVLPAWRRAVEERDALAGAALSRELLEEDDTALQAWLDQLAAFRADGSLGLRRLRRVPRAVVRRALHRWLLQHGKGERLSRQCFGVLLDSVMEGRVTRISVGADTLAEVGRERLRLVPAPQKKPKRFQRTVN